MYKKLIKKVTALMLTVVTVISLLPTGTVFAAPGDAGTISFSRTYDSNGNAMRYNSSAVINGYTAGGLGNYKYRMYVDGETAFCIQPGAPLKTGDILKESSSATWEALSSDQKKAIGLALLYGYQGNKENLTGSDDEKWLATQILVWEFATGCRQATGPYEQTSNTVHDLHFGSNYENSGANTTYEQILSILKGHNTIPSFMSKSKTGITKKLSYSGSKYTIALTDSNGVLSDYTFSCSDSNVSISKSENKLIISSTAAIDGSVRIMATRNNVPSVSESAKLIAYGDDSLQDVVTGVENADSIAAYINIKTPTGTLTLKKTSEDGVVSGIQFIITGDNYEKTVTTGSDGTISVDGMFPGSYKVTEASYDRYVSQKSQTVTIIGGKVSTVNFSNILKKWNVTVTKSDAETGDAQGDATLAGAVYGIYKGDELVDTYNTDASGQFTTSYYVCANDWSIREITPPEGYVLNPESYPIGAEAKNYTVEYSSTANDVTEQVIKGNIQLIKHLDEENQVVDSDRDSSDGNVGMIEQPEQGAIFEVYLKSIGSYDTAGDNERDLITTDINGYAKTKDLPYGVYVVHQISGMEGKAFVPDFTVYISQDGQTYYYILNNTAITAKIKIEKRDAETGELISYTGAAFKILDSNENYISMNYDYPTPTTIETFYTNDEGWLMLPESLDYGSYYLEEVQAPYGYVLDSETIPFTVDGSEDTVTVTKHDQPQKGTITVVKTGETFRTVTENNGIYQPGYSIEGLPNAVYEISAAEDIYTLDGTLRVSAGEVVDTITTDSGGVAISKELYLGKYIAKEISAPDGMILNSDPNEVAISYAGQEVVLTNVSTAFYNQRQKVDVSLKKILEQDETFGIGMNGETSSVRFGLYATEELTAADGTVIPANGLIEIISIDENGDGSFFTDLPFGYYYVQETATDEHYLISNTKYPVVFEYAGQDVALVKIAVNDCETIENELIRGSVRGIKIDEKGNALSDAVIGLFKPDETEFNVENALLTATSIEDGSFSFANVPYGDWVIREIKAPSGYVLTDASYPITILEKEQVIDLKLENSLIRGSVQIIKTDTAGNRLNGAVFSLYSAKSELLQEFSIPESGEYTVNNLLYGDYYLLEQEAPVGHVLSEEKYQFSISKNNQVVQIIVENEKMPVKETSSSGNTPKTGDDNNIRLWSALAGIAAVGVATLGIMSRYRKKKMKDENMED